MFITEYSKRPVGCEKLSLHQYFLSVQYNGKKPKKGKKYHIPNFILFSWTPKLLVTEAYTRHILQVQTPLILLDQVLEENCQRKIDTIVLHTDTIEASNITK